jgi:hypothetical protein
MVGSPLFGKILKVTKASFPAIMGLHIIFGLQCTLELHNFPVGDGTAADQGT